jgi:hypothetical protein
LIYESYVPKREDRDKRSLVRHKISCIIKINSYMI